MKDVTRSSAVVEQVWADRDGLLPGSKLSIPQLPATWLSRARLDRLLEAGCARHLMVVTGPPGSGKTAALAAWAMGQTSRRVAWASLEARDGARGRFWRSVARAVREASAVRSVDDTLRCTHCDTLASAELALQMIQAMPPGVLVLDDFHVVRDGAVLAEMSQLLRQLPPRTTVVVSGREDPPLSFARLHAADEVTCIGYDDLRLTPTESAALLSAVAGRRLGDENIDEVIARTQGWPVAVRLAGLHIRDAADPAAAIEAIVTDSAWMAPYAEEELLACSSAAVRRALSQQALVDRLTPELCAVLTGEAGPAAMLPQIAGLLTGDRVHGYRFHPLVAEVLRARLQREEPAACVAGHSRAARYFEQVGDLAAAQRHFEAAGDRARAFDVAGRMALELLRAGVVGAVPDWLGLLRGPSLADGDGAPERMLAGALTSLVAGDPWEAVRWLEQSERTSGAPDAASRDGRRQAVLAAFAATLAGDLVAARARAVVGLALDEPAASPVAAGWLHALDEVTPVLAGLLLARAHLWLGEAEAASRVAVEAGRRARDVRTEISLESVRAASAASLGQLGEATHLARTALQTAARHNLAGGPATLEAELALAWVHRERGELVASREHLETAAEQAEKTGNRPLRRLVELEVVPTLLASGDLGTAFDVITRDRGAWGCDAPAPAVEARLDELELEWRLAAGDATGAASALRRMPPERRTPLLEARVDLLAGRPPRALARLEEAGLPSGTTVPGRMEHLVLVARAAHQAGAVHRARDAMHRAIELGRSEVIVRPFLGRGHETTWLLRSLQRGYPDPYLERVLARLDAVEAPPLGADEAVVLVEGLTEREREALRRLPTHLTQQQIAAELYVSVNTLKTHLKGLYRKLGACSRAEAVAAARLRGLL